MKLSERFVKKGMDSKQREEVANAVTHGIGAGLAVTALVILVMYADAGSQLAFLFLGPP